jgi:hypothetical protein
VCINRSHLIK